MKRTIWLFVWALWLASVPAAAQSDIRRISVVVAVDQFATPGDAARNIHSALQQAWPGIAVEITDSQHFSPDSSQSTLIVAVGDSLLPWLEEHSRDYTAAIAFQVGSVEFARRIGNHPHISALYRDQPLVRQLNLAKLLVPTLRRVAILRGDQPLPVSADELQRETGVAVAEAVAPATAERAKRLAQLMRDNDVLLGIDNAALYNGDTIRSILLTTYRHGKGLIGPSRAFVNAGSLASCYTTHDHYLQQLLTMVAAAIRDRQLPEPQYPREFRVAINRQVATSLNIPVPDGKTLSAWLRDHGGECGDDC